MTEGGVNQLVKWVGATPDPTNLANALVSRSVAAKNEVWLEVIATGQRTKPANVWVTWATLATENLTPEIRTPSTIYSSDGTAKIGTKFRGRVEWRYSCAPAELFDLTGDVPNLNQNPAVPAPGGTHPWTGDDLSDGASIRYDATRQVRVTTASNDSTLLQGMLQNGPDVLAYPTDSAEGNDDPNMTGETTPYEGLVGEMTDVDHPFIDMLDSIGSSNPNSTVTLLAQFRQFARIQIGNQWYVCSDHETCELLFSLKRDSGEWIDDGSDFRLGNSFQFPPQ